MKIWLLQLFFCLLIPLVMLVNGLWHLKKPPGYINWTYGYRTRRSMRNQETWEFAQQHCGKMYCRMGSGMTAVVLIIMLCIRDKAVEVISAAASVIGIAEGIMMTCALLPTERALKRKFGV